MSNVIRNITIAFKKQPTLAPSEIIETALLVVLVVIGLFVAIMDFLGHELVSPGHAAYLTLALVGLLALHFCIERFTVMRRMEGKVRFLPLVEIKDVPQVKFLVDELTKSHNELRRLKGRIRRSNPGFRQVAEGIVDEHTRQLTELSAGKWSVPREWKVVAYERLMKQYKKRFDAVSENDLDYWDSGTTDARPYLRITSRFVSRDTIATRIFIVTENDVSFQTSRIIRVLREQTEAGIGWGLAIEEELDPQRMRLDCALYDGKQAVSIFRRQDWRYETIFATSQNDLSAYERIYENLVPKCWVVNEKFLKSYAGALPSVESAQEVKKKATTRIQDLNQALGRTVKDDDLFPFVVHEPKDLETKINEFSKTYKEYRPR